MITGAMLRDSIISGANNISNRRSSVDELNVFPVPDGDTGTNMSMTIGFAVRELEQLPDSCTVDKVASTASSALLRGARGNSGVILSLLFRGFQKSMQGRDTADSECLYRSLKRGVEAAYKAVMKPTEGTILTVAREAAEAAGEKYPVLSTTELFSLMLDTARETLVRTPEMLPILKKAGVVDAGGQGLVIIFEGMLSVLRDGVIIAGDSQAESTASAGKGVFTEDISPEMTECYCTEFLVVRSAEANAVKLRASLESFGDSVVVVDDEEIIKCHVHTRTPDRALKEALRHGYLSKIKIENMLEQYMARQAEGRAAKQAASRPAAEFDYAAPSDDNRYGLVAVAAGDGLKQLFTDLGCSKVVSGGQTMNPSTEDILEAIQATAARTVIVLANNKNIIMAAEQACKLADREAVTLPTTTVPQGISAMLSFSADAELGDNLAAMKEAADGVTTGSVTFAARDSDFDGQKIVAGSILALENGKLVYTEKKLEQAVLRLAKRICSREKSFLTVIYGSDVTEEEAEKVVEQLGAKLLRTIEITLVNGGQPVYYYYLSAE